ncbi:hypothetical protein BDW59DRAFT_35571 [Aspergillus cavernicola]|uniref:Uncharacterized protein n=1 Tax=Aspergillus cavernicola TaxID=176166 RepID=A0ABR4HBV2_9EURO
MELTAIRSLVGFLASACDKAEDAGKTELNVDFFLGNPARREGWQETATDVLSMFNSLRPFTKVQNCIEYINSLPPASLSLLNQDNQLKDWFDFLIDHPAISLEDKIRRRFCYLLFYEMKQACEHYTENAFTMLRNIILHIFPGLRHINHLQSFIDKGERFRLLSDDLGGPGILFILPQEKPETLCVLTCLILVWP